MNYAKVYNQLVLLQAFLPYHFFRGRALSPFRVQLDVTYSCNLKCPYCYQDTEYKKKDGDLSVDDVKNILHQMPGFSLVTLSGGEPFHRKDFPDILQYALNHHWCNLLSNCTLMTKENVRQMVDGDLLLLGASIDGLGELHNELRGAKVFEKIVNNLKYLQQYKKDQGKRFPLLDIKTLVLPQNISNLSGLYLLAKELEADYFTLSIPKVSEVQFNPKLFMDLNDPVFYKKRDVKAGVDRYLPEAELAQIHKLSTKKGAKVRFYPQIQDMHSLNTLFNDRMPVAEKYTPCYEPWSGMNITANGEVYPCLSYRLGSVKDTTLMEIWNSTRYKDFRNRLKSLKLFPACEGCCYLRVTQTGK